MMVRVLVLCLAAACAGFAVGAGAAAGQLPGAEGAQDARTAPASGTGAYVRVATWRPRMAGLPAQVWSEPAGIAVTQAGHVFVSDGGLGLVRVFQAEGALEREFGQAPAQHALIDPGPLAVDAARDRVYVIDAGADRIRAYTQVGDWVADWPELPGLNGIAVAPDGQVVVTEIVEDSVRVFTPDGLPVGRWGTSGDGPAQLLRPAGLDVAPDGTVYVVDQANDRVVSARLDGSARTVHAPRAADLVDRSVVNGDLVDVAWNGDSVWLATRVGLLELRLSDDRLGGFLPTTNASAVVLDPTLGMYATVSPTEEAAGVWRFRYQQASGAPKAKWAEAARTLGFFDQPAYVSVGQDGSVYLVDRSARAQRLDAGGEPLSQAVLDAVGPVATDPEANLYVAAGNMLTSFTTGGTFRWRTRLDADPSRQAGQWALAWDPSHPQLLVLDTADGRLLAFDAQGTLVRSWGLTVPGDAIGARQYWADLAVGEDGTRYVLGSGSNQITIWDSSQRALGTVDVPYDWSRFDLAPDGGFIGLVSGGGVYHLERDGRLKGQWSAVADDRAADSRPVDVAVDAAGRIYVADGGANRITVYAWDPLAEVPPPPPRVASCSVAAGVRLPATSPQCDDVPVRAELTPLCRGCPNGVNVIFVLQSTSSRYQEWQAREAATVLDALALHSGLTGRFSVVEYEGQRVSVMQRLTRSPGAVKAAFKRVARNHSPYSEFQAAARTGLNLLASAHAQDAGGGPACDLFVFFAYTKTEVGNWGRDIVKAVQLLETSGSPVLVGCPHDFPGECTATREAAHDRRHYTEFNARNEMRRAAENTFTEYAQRAGAFDHVQLTQRLPAGLRFLAGSANPPPSGQHADGQATVLEWRWAGPELVPLGPLRVSYLARAAEAGRWSIQSDVEWAESAAPPSRLRLADQSVDVVGRPCGPTPTRPPTDTPVPTPTPRPRSIYLPVVITESCAQQWVHADVVLVLDVSTSMNRLTRGGRTKLAATQDAAKAFLDAMDLSPDASGRSDQVAVVGFNRSAWIQQDLTHDRAAVGQAVDDLARGQAQLTRLDLAFERGREVLESRSHLAANTPVIILLTDGLPDQVPPAEDGSMETTVLRAAARAKAGGARVFTIGIGQPEDINPDLLRACASDPARFYYTPDAEDLAAIYTQIAHAVGCAPERFWGGR